MDVNSLGEKPGEWKATFAAAAGWFAEVVPYAVDDLDQPGLGEWTVRDLVGHTSRSLITVEDYLTDETGGGVDLDTAVAYYAVTRDVDPAVVAERGRAASAALGDDPVGFVTGLVDRVLALVDAAPPDARLHTPFGSILLAEYAITRTFELTVHTSDLLRALGRQPDPPLDAARSALHLVAELTARSIQAADVLLALTGRSALPEGFSAL